MVEVLRVHPRLIIAGTHRGVGTATIAIGLMRAMARRGLLRGQPSP